MSDYIEEIQAVFLKLHGCTAKYIETVAVLEEFQGQTVWQGEVEVFELFGHPTAQIGYGWGHSEGANDQGRRYIAVLQLSPVDSPQTAVQAGIMQEIRDARRKAKATSRATSFQKGKG
jgi:hypothetical protein